MGVFVVTLQGVEVDGGPPLTVLAFVSADERDEAEPEAVRELERLGWGAVRALRSGEVVDEAALPEDFRGAMDNARRYGCALIIYDEP
jgi:hypothetical protein